MNNSKLSFGQRLRVARIDADLSLKEVAEKIGRCRWTIINAEADQVISARTRAALLKLFPSLTPS